MSSETCKWFLTYFSPVSSTRKFSPHLNNCTSFLSLEYLPPPYLICIHWSNLSVLSPLDCPKTPTTISLCFLLLPISILYYLQGYYSKNFNFGHFILSHHSALHWFNPFPVSSHMLNRVQIPQNDTTQSTFAMWHLSNSPLLTCIIFQFALWKFNSTELQRDCRLGHILCNFQLLQTCLLCTGDLPLLYIWCTSSAGANNILQV